MNLFIIENILRLGARLVINCLQFDMSLACRRYFGMDLDKLGFRCRHLGL